MTAQQGLFGQQTDTPLAERLRPRVLTDYVGQAHLLGEGKPLASLLEQGRLLSMLLWGPPGCGKTSLALLCAEYAEANFVRLSAVFSGVKDVRSAVAQAQSDRDHGRSTILFIDEIHRFNKAQQDAFLPYVENGTIVLIGATTENPAFHLNNALLSRLRIFHLQPVSDEDIVRKLEDACRLLEVERPDDDVLNAFAHQSSGDVRKALSWFEEWTLLRTQGVVEAEALAQVLADQPKGMDKQGDWFYEMLSAFHKSLRGSSPDGAMYWFARMIEGGADALTIARRMLCVASEDIGNADPQALNVALNAYMAYERLGSPEGHLALAQAITYLAMAPKSNASYAAMNAAFALVRKHPTYAVPNHLRNAPSKIHRDEGYGSGYRYAHNEPQAYAAGQTYLPEEIATQVFYEPNQRGFESKLADKLAKLRALDEAAKCPHS